MGVLVLGTSHSVTKTRSKREAPKSPKRKRKVVAIKAIKAIKASVKRWTDLKRIQTLKTFSPIWVQSRQAKRKAGERPRVKNKWKKGQFQRPLIRWPVRYANPNSHPRTNCLLI